MPTVSVVVPNYNHARYLRKRIDSILSQSDQDFELILLDDCSTDESRDILQSYAGDPRVRIEFNEKNSGSTFKQWNKGARLARGKYVWIAESDDYADERFLEVLVARLEAEPRAVLCYCRSRQVSAEGDVGEFVDSLDTYSAPERWAWDFVADGRELCRTSLSQCNCIPNTSAVVFRREAYERVGGADERLRLCGDWKLWAAMALTGDIAYVQEPLNYFRSHGASVRKQGQQLGIEASESLVVIRSIVRGLMQNGRPDSSAKRAFPRSLVDGYRRGMEVLERENPQEALVAIEEFLRLVQYNRVDRWEIAEAWLRASRIHSCLGRRGRALLCGGRAFLVRPMIGGRPVKHALSRIAAALRG